MRKRIRIFLVLLLVVATLRTAYILYQRRQPAQTSGTGQAESSYKLTDDDYVSRRKIYAYDVKSAATELAGQTVWVSIGNQLVYYPFAASSRRVNFGHKAGLLAPPEKLQIKDVVLAAAPDSKGERQVMAIFTGEARTGEYAVSIGAEESGTYRFVASDIFFLDDPHQLYKHWPADVWEAIDRHEVKPGMNELQTILAVGNRVQAVTRNGSSVTAEYANGGKPVRVTYVDKRVTRVEPVGAATPEH